MGAQKNKNLKKHAFEIFNQALKSVRADLAVKKFVKLKGKYLLVGEKKLDLKKYQRIFIVGAGKASAFMAKALEEILGNRISNGIIITKYGHGTKLKKIQLIEAGHPVPDQSGKLGATKIKNLLLSTDQNDLVIIVLSGGGSALLPLPVSGVTLKQTQQLTKLLLNSGADIDQINTIRKHLSVIKGGQMAKLIHPSTGISLIISDVIGDRLDTIASGPTVPDKTTFSDALNILKKYKLTKKTPLSICTYLQKGLKNKIQETPRPNNPLFKKIDNFIIANNHLALEAAKKTAEKLGYNAIILSSTLQGEAKEVVKMFATLAKKKTRKPRCILCGGETTVTIKGRGLGGRNQEMALAIAIEIDGLKNITFVSIGTDGTDGPTDAAGAIVNGKTVKRAEQKGLDPKQYLENNDSYRFFEKVGGLIKTGPTKTNVMDLQILLIDNKKGQNKCPSD